MQQNRELISENSRSVESLILLAGSNAALAEDLRTMEETLKYLIPSSDSKVTEYDSTIKSLLEDLRIALVKADGETSKKADGILMKIKLAISDRNAKL